MQRTSPLIKRFLSYLEVERGLSRNTLLAYAADLLRLQNWASENKQILRGLTARDIERHLGDLNREGLDARSIARSLSTIRSLYNFLFLENEMDSNPTIEVATRTNTRTLPRVLTEEQVSLLLSQPDTSTDLGLRDRALLELLYATGVRITEAITLRHRDLNLNSRFLLCHGKGNRERQVPITRQAIEWIEKYSATKTLRLRSANTTLFLNQQKPLTRQYAWTVINHYALVARLADVTPHTLRHCFATHLLENGASTPFVQRLLGHQSILTTEIYTRVSQLYLRWSYDKHHPRAVGSVIK